MKSGYLNNIDNYNTSIHSLNSNKKSKKIFSILQQCSYLEIRKFRPH